MKTAILAALVLSGCNALGGVPPEALDAMASAGAACTRIQGLWGTGTITTANTDKGVLKQGRITVDPATCAITIENAPAAVPVK